MIEKIDMDFTELEYAGFRAWPAVHQEPQGGIVLRASNGFTKRANSANVLELQTEADYQQVEKCERFFANRSLPCIFRIPSFTNNAGLDAHLEERGYQLIDPSLVLHREIEQSQFENCLLVEKSQEAWLASYSQISGVQFEQQQLHLDMLKRIEDKTLMAVLVVDGVEVACGLGVLSDKLFGLFDIATSKSYRNQGLATKLLNGMLSWAADNDATQSYLQVVANNDAAIRLYRKLGYQDCYEYWYRIKPLESNEQEDIVELTIRPATEDDIPVLTDMFNDYVRNGYSTYKEAPITIEQMQDQFKQYSHAGPYRMLVAELDGRVVGKATSSRYREPHVFRKTVEFGIYLAPDITGKGVGSKLYTELLDCLKNEDVHLVVVGIALPNEGSVALHKKFGFKE